jgi:hypothetical protein
VFLLSAPRPWVSGQCLAWVLSDKRRVQTTLHCLIFAIIRLLMVRVKIARDTR